MDIYSANIPQFSKTELEKASSVRLGNIYEAYLSFLGDIESDLRWKRKKESSKFQTFIRKILREAHAAGSVRGANCFYGGYASEVRNGYCTHPKNASNSSYAGSCPGSDFTCNPTLFGEGVCVQASYPFANLTDRCYKEAGNPSEQDVRNRMGCTEKESCDKFLKLQKEVSEFCKNNRTYDACDSLENALGLEKSAKDTPIGAEDAISSFNNLQNQVDKVINQKDFCYQGLNQCPQGIIDSVDLADSHGVFGSVDRMLNRGDEWTFRNLMMKKRTPLWNCTRQKLLGLRSMTEGDSFQGDNEFAKRRVHSEEDYDNALKSLNSNKGFFSITGNVAQNLCNKQDGFEFPEVRAFAGIDFNIRQKQFSNAMDGYLEGLGQLNMIDPVPMNCDKYLGDGDKAFKENYKKCKMLFACANQNQNGEAQKMFDDKAQVLSMAIQSAAEIQSKINDIDGWYNNDEETEKINALKEELEAVYQANPMLREKKIGLFNREDNPLQNYIQELAKLDKDKRNVDLNSVKKKLRKKISQDREILEGKYKQAHNAHQCLIGTSQECDDMKDVIRDTSDFYPQNLYKANDKAFNEAVNYHACVQRDMQNKYESDKEFVNTAGKALLAELAIFALTGGSGTVISALSKTRYIAQAFKGSKNIKKAYKEVKELKAKADEVEEKKKLAKDKNFGPRDKLTGTERRSLKGNLGLQAQGIATTGFYGYEAFNYCNNPDIMVQMLQNSNANSCSDRKEKYQILSDMRACENAKMAALTGVGLGALGNIARRKALRATEPVRNIATELRKRNWQEFKDATWRGKAAILGKSALKSARSTWNSWPLKIVSYPVNIGAKYAGKLAKPVASGAKGLVMRLKSRMPMPTLFGKGNEVYFHGTKSGEGLLRGVIDSVKDGKVIIKMADGKLREIAPQAVMTAAQYSKPLALKAAQSLKRGNKVYIYNDAGELVQGVVKTTVKKGEDFVSVRFKDAQGSFVQDIPLSSLLSTPTSNLLAKGNYITYQLKKGSEALSGKIESISNGLVKIKNKAGEILRIPIDKITNRTLALE